MEHAVEIQQSATVTSMEQVIEIASDDSDFESTLALRAALLRVMKSYRKQ